MSIQVDQAYEDENGLLPFPSRIPNPPSPAVVEAEEEYITAQDITKLSAGTETSMNRTISDTNTTTLPDLIFSNLQKMAPIPSAEEEETLSKTGLRSPSFVQLLQAYYRKPNSDLDAGNKSTDHYKKRLTPWRYALRNKMLPLIRWETPHLARFQSASRHVLLDVYFALTANLGTHTFYVIIGPVLWWLGLGLPALFLLFQLAFGVYVTGVIKDLLCLPRPLSPPLHRITMSGSAALEYGFPSTHSANAMSASLIFYHYVQASQSSHTLLLHTLNLVYFMSIIVGRLYCGMHGFMDVLVGSLIGFSLDVASVYLIPFVERAIVDDTHSTAYLIVPIVLVLVRIHPEPSDDCPCFEDAVAFMGVIMGLVIGEKWYQDYVVSLGYPGNEILLPKFEYSAWGLFLRFAIGFFLVFAWKPNSKRYLHELLPPLFRFIERSGLSMPRKFFTPASQYKDVPNSISDTTLFEPKDFPTWFEKFKRGRSDSVGPQSPADVFESLAYRQYQKEKEAKHLAKERQKGIKIIEEDIDSSDTDKESSAIEWNNEMNFRGDGNPTISVTNDGQEGSSSSSVHMNNINNTTQSCGHIHSSHSENDDTLSEDLMSTVVIPRVKYDVEVVTKLIVYSGIAFISVYVCPIIYMKLGI